MTLVDAGPLVALFNKNDKHHSRCLEAAGRLTPPFVTTWPCFTEAMYQLGDLGRPAAQNDLWTWIQGGVLQLYAHSPGELDRMRVLMQQYSDTPMDLADASLVAAAETQDLDMVFTIDSDFYVYRTQSGGMLLPDPGPDPDTPRARRRGGAA